MKTLLKIFAFVLAIGASLIAIAVLVATVVIDPNEYRDDIATLVEDATGRTLAIDGDLSFSYFPWLGAEVDHISLGNAQGFAEPLFLSADQLNVTVRLLPLVIGQIQIGSVEVEGLRVFLTRDEEGRTNWDDLVAADAASEDIETPEEGASPLESIVIGSIDLSGGHIEWNDESAAQHYVIDDLSFNTGRVALDGPIAFDLGFQVTGGEPLITARVALSSEVLLDLEGEIYAARAVELGVQLQSEAPATEGELSLAGDFRADLAQERYSVEGFALTSTVWGESVPGGQPLTLSIATDAAIDMAAQSASFGNLAVATAGLEISGEVEITQFLDAPAYRATLSLAEFSPREVLAQLGEPPIPTADPTAFGSAAMSMRFAGSMKGVKFDAIEVTLDDTNLKGFVDVTSFEGPAVSFALEVDAIDTDRYLPPPSDEAIAPEPSESLPLGEQLASLRPLLLDGRMSIGKLVASGLALDDLSLEITAADGILQVGHLGGNLYGGTYDSEMALDVSGTQPRVSMRWELKSVEIAALLEALGEEAGIEDLGGTLSLSGAIEGDLDTQRFQASNLRLATELRGAALPVEPLEVVFTTNADIDIGADRVALSGMRVAALGLTLTGSVKASDVMGDPKYSGTVRLARFSPQALLRRLDQPLIVTTDPNVLGAMSLSTRLRGSMRAFALTDLRLVLDDTTLTGSVDIPSFRGPTVRFDLNIDAVDVDRYLPPVASDASTEVDDELPLEDARALTMNGQLKAGRLQVAGFDLSNAAVTVASKQGVFTLGPITANLYEGSYTGELIVDVTGERAHVTLNDSLAGVQAAPLLEIIAGEERLTGRTDMTTHVTFEGLDAATATATLNGKARLVFRDGAINGINIPLMIRKAHATLTGAAVKPAPEQTDFSEMSGTLVFTNGVVRNDDLVILSPLFRIDGEGTVDLNDEQIDYLLTTELVATLQGQGGLGSEELIGIPIPVRIGGAMEDPQYKVEIGKAIAASTRKMGKKIMESVKKNILGGFLGR
jgi:uncharacterized protein involved in outer membrane biogenesis